VPALQGRALAANIDKYRWLLNVAKDFACRMSSGLLNRRVTLQLYELTHRSYANRSIHACTLARTSRLQHSRHRSESIRDDFGIAHCVGADRSDVESVHQSRSTWMGVNHSDL
jgi:hypothetical protein